MNRMLVLGTEIDRISFSEAIELALNSMEHRRGDYLVTPNTEIVLCADKSPELREAICGATLSLPDSIGVEIACRILGTPIAERIPGIDFASALFGRMADRRQSVFLLGARDGVGSRGPKTATLTGALRKISLGVSIPPRRICSSSASDRRSRSCGCTETRPGCGWV